MRSGRVILEERGDIERALQNLEAKIEAGETLTEADAQLVRDLRRWHQDLRREVESVSDN